MLSLPVLNRGEIAIRVMRASGCSNCSATKQEVRKLTAKAEGPIVSISRTRSLPAKTRASGFPLIVKAAFELRGGGRGMRVIESEADLEGCSLKYSAKPRGGQSCEIAYATGPKVQAKDLLAAGGPMGTEVAAQIQEPLYTAFVAVGR